MSETLRLKFTIIFTGHILCQGGK